MSTNFYAVEDEEQPYHEGVFLGKRAGGWVFQFKWHDWTWKEHQDSTHPYRNFDELKEFIDDKTIKDEYGNVMEPEEFIDMVNEWCEENDRYPKDRKRTWEIDGYYFIKGDWC